MKKSAKIINIDQIEPRTPSGGGGLWQRLISVGDTESGLVFGYGRIKPGDARGWHAHPAGEDSISYVLEGEGIAEWKDQGKTNQRRITAGTAFYTPGNMQNNITNESENDLLIVFCLYRPDKY
jgi:mannose-6-phosphate isomerase-like protein (cupin superfamily)